MKANGKLAVDTNAVIAYREGLKPVCKLIDESNMLFLPVVVLGELLYGAKTNMFMGGMKVLCSCERGVYTNADERRFVISTHRKGRKERKAEQEDINRSMGKSGKQINSELVRTDTNSSHSEFARVSLGSLLMFTLLHIFIVIYERSSEDKST